MSIPLLSYTVFVISLHSGSFLLNLGNLSNSSINKWGLNLFWYNFWIVDKNYAEIIQQDKIIQKLIFFYLNFGVLFPKNIFFNKYWYLNKFSFLNYFNEHNLKYYRMVNFKNEAMGIDSNYTVRNKIKNTYFTKIWILRYQKWLIINYYCFRPMIRKKNDDFSWKKKDLLFFMKENKKKTISFKRLKLILFFFINIKFNTNFYYKF